MDDDLDDLVEDPMGAVARKSLHVILMADTSDSMGGYRIESLNQVARTVLDELAEVASSNVQAEIFLRVIEFATGAQWQTAEPTPVEDFVWKDLRTNGLTSMGAAIDLLTEALNPGVMGPNQYPPVITLLTDGLPTDDWRAALSRFNDSPYGKERDRTVRVAIGIGEEPDESILEAFTGNTETVFTARTPHQLQSLLRFSTVRLTQFVSETIGSGDQDGPPMPDGPEFDPDDDGDGVEFY